MIPQRFCRRCGSRIMWGRYCEKCALILGDHTKTLIEVPRDLVPRLLTQTDGEVHEVIAKQVIR